MVECVLFVESNTTGTGRQFCDRARDRGLKPVVVARDPLRFDGLFDAETPIHQVDTGDLGAALDCARELEAESGLRGVMSSSEYFVATAAQVAAAVGLPGPSARAVQTCRRKHLQRRALAETGLAQPLCRRVAEVDEVAAAIEVVGLPAVIKPEDGSGSVDVRLCDDAQAAIAQYRKVVKSRPGASALVESYVAGPEFSVEILDGVPMCIVSKRLTPPPHFLETGHDVPAVVSAAEQQMLRECATSAVAALGLGWGPVHVELRLSVQGPVVIEVNPRLAGGRIPDLVAAATGIDLVGAAVDRAIGAESVPQSTLNRFSAIRFLVARPGLRAQDIPDLTRLRGAEGAISVEVSAAATRRHELTGSFRDRIGHVMAVADSAADAGLRVEALLDELIETITWTSR